MATTKGNGLDAPHNQPAKILTNHDANFIANLVNIAIADAGLTVAFAVVALQAALMALAGVLQ
jgi:hypothetical protein